MGRSPQTCPERAGPTSPRPSGPPSPSRGGTWRPHLTAMAGSGRRLEGGRGGRRTRGKGGENDGRKARETAPEFPVMAPEIPCSEFPVIPCFRRRRSSRKPLQRNDQRTVAKHRACYGTGRPVQGAARRRPPRHCSLAGSQRPGPGVSRTAEGRPQGFVLDTPGPGRGHLSKRLMGLTEQEPIRSSGRDRSTRRTSTVG